MSTASHSLLELDEDDLDGEDADAGDVDGGHVDHGNHDHVDGDDSSVGDVDDLGDDSRHADSQFLTEQPLHPIVASSVQSPHDADHILHSRTTTEFC